MKIYKPKDIKLTKEQREELNKITNEIVDDILVKEHETGAHTCDKKKHCPLCVQEQLKP